MNYYTTMAAKALLPGDESDAVKLRDAYVSGLPSELGDGSVKINCLADGIFIYSDENFTGEEFSGTFCTALAGVIAKSGRQFLEFGYSLHCDKVVPGGFGGGNFRVNINGAYLQPYDNWLCSF